MRLLLSCLILLSATALPAGTIILSEDFEGATAGTPVNGYNGWSGADNILISATTIDQGQSAENTVGESDWPTVSKSFSYTPATGEHYEFSAVLDIDATWGDYAHVQIDNGGAFRAAMMLGYGDLIFQWDDPDYYDNAVRVGESTEPMDAKMLITDTQADCYWRMHGDPTWIHAGTLTASSVTPPALSDYDNVLIAMHGGFAGNVDTISVTAVSGSVLSGDLNGDGLVGSADLDIVRAAWGTSVEAGCLACGDPSGDGQVGSADLDIVRANWGQGGTPRATSAVPEPATLIGLVSLVAAGLLCRRGREG